MAFGRYVTSQLVVAILVVVVSLTCVIWLSQSLRFIDMIVNRGLPLFTFVYLTVLLMPSFLAIVLPIAAFAAVLFVYNRMISDRELVVFSASGMSPLGQIRPALAVMIGTTLVCYLLTLYLLPMSYRGFKELQFKIRHNYTQILLREGVFNSIGEEITVFVRERGREGELFGIIVQDDRDEGESVTLIAEHGALIESETGPSVLMEKGNRQARDRDSGRVSLLYFDRYTVDLGGLNAAVQRTFLDMNELFVHELLWPDETITQAKNFQEYRAEGHSRLITPLLALVLPLIGLAVLLSTEFSRKGQAGRLLLAVLLAGILEGLALGSKFIAAKQPWFVPGMYAIIALPIVLGLMALSRSRIRRPGAPPEPGSPERGGPERGGPEMVGPEMAATDPSKASAPAAEPGRPAPV